MYNKMIGLIFLATFTLSYPAFAVAEADEPAEQPESSEEAAAEQPESSEEMAAEQEEAAPKESGHGWQLISSLELGKSGKFAHMVLVDRDKTDDLTVYSSAINRICGKAEEFCRIRFWNQKKYIPEKIALNEQQSKNLLAEYTFNKTGGIHETRWSCAVNPSRQDCFTN